MTKFLLLPSGTYNFTSSTIVKASQGRSPKSDWRAGLLGKVGNKIAVAQQRCARRARHRQRQLPGLLQKAFCFAHLFPSPAPVQRGLSPTSMDVASIRKRESTEAGAEGRHSCKRDEGRPAEHVCGADQQSSGYVRSLAWRAKRNTAPGA